jgi:hypothetical protein
MPDIETQFIHTKTPFSAEVIVKQESCEKFLVKDNGYQTTPIKVDGGIIAKFSVTADTLESLQKKIAGHVALLE